MLLGQAAGDALGVPYEFATPPGPGELAVMRGGGLGPYAPGEWSDDTQMAICIARVSSTGVDLRTEDALDAVAAGFEEWYVRGASDVGVQTRTVLNTARGLGRPAARLRAAAAELHRKSGRTAGNGALMRTGVVGLVALDDRVATAEAARAVAEITHADPLAAESCILWSEAVRVAVTRAELDPRAGLDLLPADRRGPWADWLDAAERTAPADAGHAFSGNGFTVTALQAAWHAIVTTPGHGLVDALQAAVRIGGDADTVAAIAGALLGARWGAAAVPPEWRAAVHGWPGLRAADLERLALATAEGAPPRAR